MPMLRASRPAAATSRRSVSAMAAARSIGRSTIGWTTASAVATSSASAPGPRPPHSRTTGVPRGRASVATPIAVLPCSVCSSARPSPVITRSAVSSASARPTSSATTSTPGRTTAPVKPMQPGGRPARRARSGQVGHEATGRGLDRAGRRPPARRPAPRRRPRRRPSAGRTWRRHRAGRTAGSSRRRRPEGSPRVSRGSSPPASIRDRPAREAPPSGSSAPSRQGNARRARAAARCRHRSWPIRRGRS